MRGAVRWVYSLASSATPGPSRPQQAQQPKAEALTSVDGTFRDESNEHAPPSLAQESVVNPGTRLNGAAEFQTSSCPVFGQLGHERQATLPTISEEVIGQDRQSSADDLPSISEDLQGLPAVGNDTSAEVSQAASRLNITMLLCLKSFAASVFIACSLTVLCGSAGSVQATWQEVTAQAEAT